MRSGRTKAIVAAGALLLASVAGWAQRGPGWGMRAGANGGGSCATRIESMPKQALDAAETAQLLFMREEEKLARDVYAQLYARWGSPVFGRISQSEQRHFDAIKVLVDRYGLADPAAGRAVGEFSDPGLQALYGDLVAKGQASIVDAFLVGATIEDLDIRDLNAAIAATDNVDLKTVYQNLEAASRNHMRAFHAQLTALNASYTATYISPELLKEILETAPGKGMGRGGRGPGSGNFAPGAGACVSGDCSHGAGTGTCPYGNAPGTGTRRPGR